MTRETRTRLLQKSWDANGADSKKHTIHRFSSEHVTVVKVGG